MNKTGTLAAAALVSLAVVMPPKPAPAQDALSGGLIGGTAGAIIGGLATRRPGGALVGGLIGGTAGALIGANAQRRRGGFYWYRGRCYQAVYNRYRRVPRRYCY